LSTRWARVRARAPGPPLPPVPPPPRARNPPPHPPGSSAAADRHAQVLSDKFPGIRFTVESKADAKYPIVGAASIAAKVSRDHLTQGMEFAERFAEGTAPSREFGSGYPSDPTTKAWIEGSVDPVFGYPSVVRFSWGTCKTALDAR